MSPFNILIIFATFKKCIIHSIILYFISKTIINQQYSTAKIHVKNAGHIGLFKLRFGEGIFVCLKSLSTSFNANSYSMMCTIEILYQY